MGCSAQISGAGRIGKTPQAHATQHSPIKLAALDIDTIFLDSHAQILHGQHRAALSRTTLATTAKPAPLHTKLRRLLPALPRGAGTRCAHARRAARPADTYGPAAERIVGGRGIRRPDPAVLVRVGGDVGDEFLGREREQACQWERRRVCARPRWVGRRWRWEARER